MPIWMPSDTQALLGTDGRECKSRSLFMDRFAHPGAKEDERKRWFNGLIERQPAKVQRQALGRGSQVLYAQLQSRLMVNMAGGVMENAGLCLDRFGLPYLPGSAVKGCARRMAIQSLLELRETGAEPESIVQMLSEIAFVFGWTEQDWSDGKKNGRFKSDFAYAVGSALWSQVSQASRQSLLESDHFAGSVSFLPAWPVDASGVKLPIPQPTPGKLELDVLTCHHAKYYRGERPVAIDDDSPNPVLFPAVAAGHVFAFPLLPLRNCTEDGLRNARSWLADGLFAFGLGAKTSAGYGWFDASKTVNDLVQDLLKGRIEREAKEAQVKSEKEAKLKAEQLRIARKKEQEQAVASMSEEERLDFELDQMDDNQRLQWVERFDQRTDGQKLAIYRLLRLRNPDFWKELRHKAEHGKQKEIKRFSPVVQEMFKLAKQRKEKMP